jgi:hypothetical protein
MHPYSASMTDRPRVIGATALVAALAFLLVGLTMDAIGWRPSYWVSTPSAVAIFGVLFGLYDRRLWRLSMAGFRLSQVPDLNGIWGGTVEILVGVRRREEEPTVDCAVTIRQTWSKIQIDFETEFSSSRSSMAAFNDSDLHYEFTADRKAGTDFPRGMNTHHGLARLKGVAGWRELHGDFFNDPLYPRSGPYHLRPLPRGVQPEEWLAERTAERAHPRG